MERAGPKILINYETGSLYFHQLQKDLLNKMGENAYLNQIFTASAYLFYCFNYKFTYSSLPL